MTNSKKDAKEARERKAIRARQMSFDEKLAAGAQLYAQQRELAKDMLMGLNPSWTAQQAEAELDRREKLIRARDSKRFFRVISDDELPVDEP